MLTFQYDLTLQQGASFDRTLYYSSGAERTPVDLSTCTDAWLVIRRKDAKRTQVLRLDKAGGGLQLANGSIRILIQDSQSAKFSWDDEEGADYVCFVRYPVSADFPAGYAHKLLKGDVVVEH
jgi:hypothetical protein